MPSPLLNCFVQPSKISHYLLNLAHKDGASKAKFFMNFGFDPSCPQDLLNALLEHAATQPIIETWSDEWGERWNVRGPIRSPDERNPVITSGWVKDSANPPRLTTALP